MAWASGVIARNPGSAHAMIVAAWRAGIFDALFSGELLNEIADTLKELGADRADIVEFLMLLASRGTIVPIKHQKMGCRDEEDDHLYEVAITAEAQYVVSRDFEVLNPPGYVAEYLASHGVELKAPPDFCEVLGKVSA